MRSTVHLGLLCLSLLISSLNGEEINADSMQIPVNMDEDMEDFSHFQVAENEEERNLLFHDSDIVPVNFRVKRQDNGKKPRRKKQRPGSVSTLAMNMPTMRVKRQSDNKEQRQRKKPRPGMFSVLGKAPSQVLTS